MLEYTGIPIIDFNRLEYAVMGGNRLERKKN